MSNYWHAKIQRWNFKRVGIYWRKTIFFSFLYFSVVVIVRGKKAKSDTQRCEFSQEKRIIYWKAQITETTTCFLKFQVPLCGAHEKDISIPIVDIDLPNKIQTLTIRNQNNYPICNIGLQFTIPNGYRKLKDSETIC